MKKSVFVVVIIFLVGAVMVTACSSQKGPAEAAVKAVEDALNAAKGEAVKYVPDEVKSVEGALGALKEKFTKGDYKAVIAEAAPLLERTKGLAAAAAAKKEELTKSWAELSEGLPKMVETIQAKIDSLSKMKKLPANLSKEGFEEIKSGMSALKEEWTKAQDNFKEGNVADAVSIAKSVKEKALKAMETLGLPAPGGVASQGA